MRASENHNGMVFSQQCSCACNAMHVLYTSTEYVRPTQTSWLYSLDYDNYLDSRIVIIALDQVFKMCLRS